MIFGLNTIVGFACAVGVNMGFNASHYDETVDVSVHVHSDGKKHQHDESNKDHHDKKDPSKKDGCCDDKVISFQTLDKNLAQNAQSVINITVIILNSFFGINFFKPIAIAPQKFIIPTSHPPPADIRIIIRSFQI